jgi:hypothetical protein
LHIARRAKLSASLQIACDSGGLRGELLTLTPQFHQRLVNWPAAVRRTGWRISHPVTGLTSS